MSNDCVRERHGLGAAVDQREADARLGHQPAGVLELALGEVEPDRPRATLRQRDRPLRRPAAELEDVATLDLAEDPELDSGICEVPQAIPPLSASWAPWSAWYSSL